MSISLEPCSACHNTALPSIAPNLSNREPGALNSLIPPSHIHPAVRPTFDPFLPQKQTIPFIKKVFLRSHREPPSTGNPIKPTAYKKQVRPGAIPGRTHIQCFRYAPSRPSTKIVGRTAFRPGHGAQPTTPSDAETSRPARRNGVRSHAPAHPPRLPATRNGSSLPTP